MTALQSLTAHDPDQVRSGLEAAELAAPHEFIREVDAAYDRRVHLDRLLRDLPEGDDLRFAHGSGVDERWVIAERLPWDSEFFGRGFARLHAVASPAGPIGLRDDTTPAVEALEATLVEARGRGISYVFGFAEPRDLPTLRTLHGAGFELIESRILHHKPLGPAPERYDVRTATPDDIPTLAQAAKETVNHFDRFHSDPAISPEDADRLMEEWVRVSVTTDFADWTIVPDVESPEAFVTARLYRDHWDGWGAKLAQPIISAVAPSFRGWYRRLISEFEQRSLAEGADHAFLSTQMTNNAVVAGWEKLGYLYGKGEHVFRREL